MKNRKKAVFSCTIAAAVAMTVPCTALADGIYSWQAVADTLDGVFIRAAATTESDVVGSLPTCGLADVIEVGDEWTLVSSGDVQGYVKNEFLAMGERADYLASVYGFAGVRTDWDGVCVFSRPDGCSQLVETANAGAEFVVVEDQGDWLAVETASGSVAYVAAEDVKSTTVLPRATAWDDAGQTGASTWSSSVSWSADTYTEPQTWEDTMGTGTAGGSGSGETWTDDSASWTDTTGTGIASGSDYGETWTDDSASWTDTTGTGTASGSDYGETWTDDTIYDADWTDSTASYDDSNWTDDTIYDADWTDSTASYDDSASWTDSTGSYDDTAYGSDYSETWTDSTGSYDDTAYGSDYSGTWTDSTTGSYDDTTYGTDASEYYNDTASETEAPSASVSSSDLDILAGIIYCEAGNQSYEGKVAVGAVVMNRIASGSFPGSISEVVYQSGQFTPASSGWLDSVLANGVPTDCYEAAQAALNGDDPTGGCLYFNAGSGSGIQIGAHQFY